MFKWFERRKALRREDDQRLRFDDVIKKKKEAAEAAIERMKQFTLETDRRFHSVVVDVERRRA